MKSKLLAARINPWQEFKIRRAAVERNLPLGLILSEAIQVYTTSQYSEETIQRWLEEYHREVDQVVSN